MMIFEILSFFIFGFALSIPLGPVGLLIVELFVKNHKYSAWGFIIGEALFRILVLGILIYNSNLITHNLDKPVVKLIEGIIIIVISVYFYEKGDEPISEKKEVAILKHEKNKFIPSLMNGFFFAITGISPFALMVKFNLISASTSMPFIFFSLCMYLTGTWIFWKFSTSYIKLIMTRFSNIKSSNVLLMVEQYIGFKNIVTVLSICFAVYGLYLIFKNIRAILT